VCLFFLLTFRRYSPAACLSVCLAESSTYIHANPSPSISIHIHPFFFFPRSNLCDASNDSTLTLVTAYDESRFLLFSLLFFSLNFLVVNNLTTLPFCMDIRSNTMEELCFGWWIMTLRAWTCCTQVISMDSQWRLSCISSHCFCWW